MDNIRIFTCTTGNHKTWILNIPENLFHPMRSGKLGEFFIAQRETQGFLLMDATTSVGRIHEQVAAGSGAVSWSSLQRFGVASRSGNGFVLMESRLYTCQKAK